MSEAVVNPHRKTLHSKRSFASTKHSSQLSVDSPLYDASEEDNTDDASSAASPSARPYQHPHHTSPLAQGKTPSSTNKTLAPTSAYPPKPLPTTSGPLPTPANRLLQELEDEGDVSSGVDSPTYDGDIESSTRAIPAGGSAYPKPLPSPSPSVSSFIMTPSTPHVFLHPAPSNTSDVSSASTADLKPLPIPKSTPRVLANELPSTSTSPVEPEGKRYVDTIALTAEDIRSFVRRAINGEPEGGVMRDYRVKEPPPDRVIRIYADGVYDIFHFGHALQLRQAKLSFPRVHLLVGVCSDTLCKANKSLPVLTHFERCENVRHCKWVDEVVPEAPWVLDQAFLDKWRIDYVAHDEIPYGKGPDGTGDLYDWVKASGTFLPTRRTSGISTSDILERLVSNYRSGEFDQKLEKMGHAELKAEGSEFSSSRAGSRGGSRPESRTAVRDDGTVVGSAQ